MKKWEALHLTPDNSKQNRMEYVQDKESSRYQVCEFFAEGSSEGRLISEMSSEFVWSLFF